MHEFRQVSFSVMVDNAFQARVYERNPRRGLLQPKFLQHRFPIKGGLTFADVLADNLTRKNALLERLLSRNIFGDAA